ncbi:MAG: hypothetical protein Kow0075_05900 [Salibacteraceae bacterium]
MLNVFNPELNAQQLEIVATGITSTTDMRTAPGMQTGVYVVLRNADSIAITDTTSIHITVKIGNQSIADSIKSFGVLTQGDSIAHFFGRYKLLQTPLHHGSFELESYITYMYGSVQYSDSATVTYLATDSINNDWSAVEINVVDPQNLDSFDLDNNTNTPPPLREVSVTLRNNGELTYVFGTPVHYSLLIDSQPPSPVSYAVDDNLFHPGSETVRHITNSAVLPMIPATVGTHTLCGVIHTPLDSIMNNDTVCQSFTLVDNYDPNDPKNWPNGTDELVKNGQMKIMDDHNQLVISCENAIGRLQIIDLTGKLVLDESFHSETRLARNMLRPGLYVATLTSTDGKPITEKFVVRR